MIQEIAILFRDSNGTHKALIGSPLRQSVFINIKISGYLC